jgi:hypothetical protein
MILYITTVLKNFCHEMHFVCYVLLAVSRRCITSFRPYILFKIKPSRGSTPRTRNAFAQKQISQNKLEQRTQSKPFYLHTTYPLKINKPCMTEPSLTTLIGDEIQGRDKRWDFMDGKDGFFYGIPSNARRRVVKFNPLDKSFVD